MFVQGIKKRDRKQDLFMGNIILIGMPASGKSTVGRRLAKKLNMDFVDTDNLIEESEGMRLQDIIDNKGNFVPKSNRAYEEDGCNYLS